MGYDFKSQDMKSWLNSLYLGIPREKLCMGYTLRCPTTSEVLKAETLSTMKYGQGTNAKNEYFNSLLVFYSFNLDGFMSFEDWIDRIEVMELKSLAQEVGRLLDTTPKVETISDDDVKELCELLKENIMSRYRWSLCEKYGKTPAELFCDSTKLTDEQLLWIFINNKIDAEDKYEHYCDDCRNRVDNPELYCYNCGQEIKRNWIDCGETEMPDADDFWLRRSQGVYNKETGEWELPKEKTEEEYAYDFELVKADEEIEDFVEDEEIDDELGLEEESYEYDGDWDEVKDL